LPTATATAAPEPTNVPVPTIAPTATTAPELDPTEVPPPVDNEVNVVVGKYQLLKDTAYSQIVGFITNRGEGTIESVEVVGSVIGLTGKTLSTGDSIYVREIIPPGQRSPFLIVLQPAQFGKYKQIDLQVEADPYDPEGYAATGRASGLSIEGTNDTPPSDEYNPYTITGQVRNKGKTPAQYVSITAIFFDKSGKPLGVQNSYTDLDRVRPGKTSPFSLTFYGDTARQVARYELWVNGSKDD